MEQIMYFLGAHYGVESFGQCTVRIRFCLVSHSGWIIYVNIGLMNMYVTHISNQLAIFQ